MDKSRLDKLDKGKLIGEQKDRVERLKNLRERLESGAPADNVSGAEAAVAYRAATRNLSPEQVEEATAEALGKLPAEDRQKVSAYIKQQGGDQFADLDDDPQHLAHASTQLGATQSAGLDGLLGSLLGGAQASSGGSGITDLLENPLVKTVLASVATTAMSKFAGGGGQGGGLDDMLGGLLGGGGSGASDGGGGGIGGMLSDLLGGEQQGGGLDDLLGGLLGGGSPGEQPKASPSRRNEM